MVLQEIMSEAGADRDRDGAREDDASEAYESMSDSEDEEALAAALARILPPREPTPPPAPPPVVVLPPPPPLVEESAPEPEPEPVPEPTPQPEPQAEELKEPSVDTNTAKAPRPIESALERAVASGSESEPEREPEPEPKPPPPNAVNDDADALDLDFPPLPAPDPVETARWQWAQRQASAPLRSFRLSSPSRATVAAAASTQQEPPPLDIKEYAYKEGWLLKAPSSALAPASTDAASPAKSKPSSRSSLAKRFLPRRALYTLAAMSGAGPKPHERWFVLTGGLLMHSTTPDSASPRGAVSLRGARVELVESLNPDEALVLVVEATARSYVLYPSTRRDAFEWLEAIRNNISCAEAAREAEASLTRALSRPAVSERTLGVLDMLHADVTTCDVDVVTTEAGTKQVLPRAREEIGALYALLGVDATASESEIRKRFYAMAKEMHPDKKPSAEASRAFASVTRAFEVLTDAESRSAYDLMERVKDALRRGVAATVHDEDGETWAAGLWLGPSHEVLYLQPAEHGSVLQRGFTSAELRFVQEIVPGEACEDWCPPPAAPRCLEMLGQRLGHAHIRLELDTPDARDEFLDGLRALRCSQSALFKQKLDAWVARGGR